MLSSRSTGCPSIIRLGRTGCRLHVTSFDLRHNHTISPLLYARHPVQRRLTGEQLSECRELLEYDAPIVRIKDFISEKFNKNLSTPDIYSLRSKVKEKYSRKLLQ